MLEETSAPHTNDDRIQPELQALEARVGAKAARELLRVDRGVYDRARTGGRLREGSRLLLRTRLDEVLAADRGGR